MKAWIKLAYGTAKSRRITGQSLQTHSSQKLRRWSKWRELEQAFIDELLGTNRLLKAVYILSAATRFGRAVITGS